MDDDDNIPQDLIEDDEILETLQELVKDAEIFALCPKCKIALAVEEYESCKCVQCGSIDQREILYIYREHDPSRFN